MSDAPTVDTKALEWGRHLAGLPEDQRRVAVATARQALVANLPADEVGKAPVRTLGQYLDDDIELPPILVKPGLVARGAVTSMTARGGKGKTAVSLNKLIRWSMGKPLFDELPEILAPIEPLRILLIENEGAPGHFQKVLRTILLYEDHDGNPQFSDEARELARENLHIWGDGGWSGLKLDNPENIALVKRGVEACKPDIVFVEPFRGLWRGDENSSTEMANVIDSLSEIANQYDCGVMLTHHERKGASEADAMDAARGSTVLEGAAAVMEQWAPVKAGAQRELQWVKARFEEAPAPIRMCFERDRWGYRLVAEDESVRTVLTVLRETPDAWLTVSEIAEEVGETTATARRWLQKGIDAGHVKRKAMDGGHRFRAVQHKTDDEAEGLAIT